MFKNLLSTVLNFATGGSSTVYFIAGAFLAGSISGWYITSDHYEAKIAKVNQEAYEHETKVVAEQAKIAQNTQNAKDSNEAHYQLLLNQYRSIGLRNSSLQTNGSATLAIPSQGLRLLEPDAEVLIGFAKSCQDTEIERNDVIQKYNALMVK